MEDSNRLNAYKPPFRTSEAAVWLGLSERKVLELARKGVLKGKKVGHIWLFSQEAVANLAGVPIDE